MKRNPARDYLHLTASSASSVGLVVLLYDLVLEALHRALQALEEDDTEQRTAELNRAIAALGELQGSLDFTRGDEVARWLGHFYTRARGKIIEAHIKASEEILRQLAAEFLSVREAWQQVEQSVTAPVALPPPAPTNAAASRGLVGEEPASTHWSA